MQQQHHIGLRFQRRDAPLLRAIAARLESGELRGPALTTFDLAADAAETGEPLIVVCKTPLEAVMMAAGYSQFGVTPPTLEQVSPEHNTLGGAPRTGRHGDR